MVVVRTDVRISKDETTAELILDPIHLAADDTEESFTVDEDLDSVLLDHLVECAGLGHVFEMIGKSATTSIAHAHSDELRIRSREELTELSKGTWRERHGRLAWT